MCAAVALRRSVTGTQGANASVSDRRERRRLVGGVAGWPERRRLPDQPGAWLDARAVARPENQPAGGVHALEGSGVGAVELPAVRRHDEH